LEHCEDVHRGSSLNAAKLALRDDIDLRDLQKTYGGTIDESGPQVRYSPATCLGCEKKVKIGDPEPEHISTSFAEITAKTHASKPRNGI
jgi:hypothetical protein